MAATRKDVAKMAGVSVATVSYVINNTRHVTPEVRERVLNAVKVLNYHPNLLAQSLSTKKTRHVAMLIDNIQNPHYGRIMRGVQHAAQKEGYIVSVLSTNYSSKESMIELVSRGVEGVILALGFYQNEDFTGGLELPVVYEDETLRTDYRQAIFDIVETLKNLGHRRIGFLSGLPAASESIRCQDFLAALKHYDLEFNKELYIEGNGYTDEKAGYDAAERLLDTGESFTAVFTLNDLMALGAMRKLSEAGLHIPNDVSIVGCDGIKSSAYTVPSLSTIQCHAFHLGEALMYKLISKIQPEKEVPIPDQVIQAEFIRRESIGPVPVIQPAQDFLLPSREGRIRSRLP